VLNAKIMFVVIGHVLLFVYCLFVVLIGSGHGQRIYYCYILHASVNRMELLYNLNISFIDKSIIIK
jgi:hypothetical protein